MSYRILIVDDHQIIRDGLRLMMENVPGADVVGSCGDCATAWQLACEFRPDLALIDLILPDGSGITLTRRLRAELPATKVLVFTGSADRHIAVEAVEAGAIGFLLKTSAPDELLVAVRTVLAGGVHLGADISAALGQGLQSAVITAADRVREALPLREGQVLALFVRGLRNKEIAAELGLNVKTVETYRSRLMKRFNCTSPVELMRHAIRTGLAEP